MAIFSLFSRTDDPLPEIVPEKFSWLAALLPPLYALVHGLWLGLAHLGVLILVVAASILAGGTAGFWLYVLAAILIGFEAPAWRTAKLARKGFSHRADLVAGSGDEAMVEYLRGRTLP